MARMVNCAKLGKELPAIPYKPFNNELGQRIYDNVSMDAWKVWLEFSKMIVNEYRLDLTSARGRRCCTSRPRSTSSAKGRSCRPTTCRRRPSSRREVAGGQSCAARATSSSSRATSPATSRRGWRRRWPSCARAGFAAGLPRPGGRAARRRRPRAPGGGAPGRDLGADAHGPALGLPRRRARAARRTRRAHVCFFGLYAALNEQLLAPDGRRRSSARDCEEALVALAQALEAARGASAGAAAAWPPGPPAVASSPIATRCPPLAEYARLAIARRAPRRRARRGDPRLQAPVPPLPDPAGLRGPLLRRAARGRARGRPRAGRGRRAPHRLRRSRLPERRRRTRCASRARCTRRTPS